MRTNNSVYLVLLLISFSIQAQDRDQLRDRDRIHEYLVMEDGILLHVRDQDRIRLQDKLTLLDGTEVNVDGRYKSAEGDRLRLLDGQCLDFDGNKYASQQQFQQHLSFREQAANQLHFAFKDGYAYQVQDGQQIRVTERVALKNGGNLSADGSYQFENQPSMRLRQGQSLDQEGNLFQNEVQYRNQTRLRLQANAAEHFEFQDGKMYRIQNETQTQLREQQALQNGLVVNPDGSYQDRDLKRLQLRDGECIDADGNHYASREQFREQAQLHLQARNQEHFVNENGQMSMVLNGERSQVRERLNLENGLSVNPDGSYKLRNKKQERLANGEILTPDGNRYRSQQEFNQQMQNRLMAMAQQHFVFQNGKLYRSQNNVQIPAQQRWALQNGATINPDGSYQSRDGKREQLRNGELMDWEGNRYENRERFREKMDMRQRDRMEMRNKEMHERTQTPERRKRPTK